MTLASKVLGAVQRGEMEFSDLFLTTGKTKWSWLPSGLRGKFRPVEYKIGEHNTGFTDNEIAEGMVPMPELAD